MANQNVLDALKVVTEALTVPVTTTVQAEVLTKHTVSEGEYFVMLEADHGWFSLGDVIKLTRKDGTEAPKFTDAKGLTAYVHLPRLRRATPDEVAEAFPTTKAFAKGTVVKVIGNGGGGTTHFYDIGALGTVERESESNTVIVASDVRSQYIAKTDLEVLTDAKLIDGKLYEKVDEKAAIGDYICYDEIDRSYLTAGKLYEVINLDAGDAIIEDDDDEWFDTWTACDFDVYKPVKNEAPPADDAFIEVNGLRYDKVEGAVRVGDYITASHDFDDITVGKKYGVYALDFDGDGLIRDDDDCERYVDADRIQAIYRRALDEREESFVKFGREVDEFKVGDIVEARGIKSVISTLKATYSHNTGMCFSGAHTGFISANADGDEHWELIKSASLVEPIESRLK
ncbi:hypothetical protein [Listeria booriae]|uniref:Uncharacterized protein n=1 Tax=Listeria booriae TaxID=1552123 RepID=A0A7X0TLK4_9LIST|nr:hypothetical protein [Listeria booriae]MBC1331102.1 hypothetical protein [Listeria booriae]